MTEVGACGNDGRAACESAEHGAATCRNGGEAWSSFLRILGRNLRMDSCKRHAGMTEVGACGNDGSGSMRERREGRMRECRTWSGHMQKRRSGLVVIPADFRQESSDGFLPTTCRND